MRNVGASITKARLGILSHIAERYRNRHSCFLSNSDMRPVKIAMAYVLEHMRLSKSYRATPILEMLRDELKAFETSGADMITTES